MFSSEYITSKKEENKPKNKQTNKQTIKHTNSKDKLNCACTYVHDSVFKLQWHSHPVRVYSTNQWYVLVKHR